MLAWLLASRLMLHFGPIQALGIHGRRLVITTTDDRSVITRAGKQRPHPWVTSQRQVDMFGTMTDLQRVSGHCLMQACH